MNFTDPDQLLAAIANDMEIATNNVGNQIADVVKEYVQAYVYDPYTPVMYKRTHEFYESWIAQKIRNGFSASVEIFSDPERMEFSPPIHGRENNIYAPLAFMDDFGEKDRRPIMARLIANGSDYDFVSADPDSNWWTRPRDYWTPALGEIDGTFDSNVRIQFKKLGINII